MAIYIKGVAIPTNCTDCRYRPLVGCNPYQDNGLSPSDHRHRTCPLTEVAEPHGRLIDADALADDLETDGKEFESGKRVIEHLKQMPSAVCDDCIWHVCNYNKVDWDTPSAEAVQGWVPCSERLPEKGELVLVTVWNDVTIAWRNIYGGWDSAEDMYEKGDVIAWMPLPKPYREEKQNG